MKKLALSALLTLVIGCTSQSNTSSIGGNSDSVEGTYFDKKQRITLTLKKSDASTYLMDTKSLTGETKGQVWKKMSDKEIADFFKGREGDVKAGQFFASTDNLCTSVFIKYENDDDGYMANCMIPSLTRYVKQ